MSYKQRSPLPIIEGGTGADIFEMAIGEQGFGVIVGGQFSTSPLQIIQSPGTIGQVLTSNGIAELPTWEDVSAVGVVSTLTGDTGGAISPSIGNINIVADVAALNAGASVLFAGSGSTITLNVTDASDNTIIGKDAGNATLTGDNNTILGQLAGALLTDGIQNVMVGVSAGSSITTGGANTLIGVLAGGNYVGNEHSNICLGYSVEGTAAETNTLRIGDGTGTAPGQLNKAVICGIAGKNVGSVATVVTESGDQLGTAVITAGTGISIVPGANTITIEASSAVAESFAGDSGTATPSLGVLDIKAGVSTLNCGSTVEFTGSGNTITLNVTDGDDNIIIGSLSGNGTIIGNSNTILGQESTTSLTSGSANVIIGQGCAISCTTGASNVMVGSDVAAGLITGNNNVLIGNNSGFDYAGSESSNILIGASVAGVPAESHVLRIGFATGNTNPGDIAAAYICGINAVNVGSVATVVTENGNQLGTAVITAGSGITVTPGANTITIAATGGGGGITDISGDTGGAQSGPSIALNAASTAGFTVNFSGTTNTISLNVSDTSHNTFIGDATTPAGLSASNNIALGYTAGASASTISGDQNIMIGNGTGAHLDSGSSNIMIGANAGNGLTSGQNNIILGINAAANAALTGTQNIILGGASGASLANGASNIYIGENAGATSADDNANMAIGINAGTSINGGTGNVLIGNASGTSLVAAGHNTMIGLNAGNSIGTGIDNVIIGSNAGTGFGSNESSNVIINDNGTVAAGQSNVLAIGAGTGTGNFQLNQSFIHGIRGITTVNADAIAVLIDSAGQLGTVSSSAKVKHDIADMNDASSAIMNLRPVTFVYNNDPYEKTQYGLIAEEVNEIFPGITAFNKDGEVESVQYHLLPVLLLNEIKKLNARIAALEAKFN